MANRKILFLTFIFGAVLFWAGSYPANADCASCTQECNNLNANAPEVPTDCDAYCSSQCNISTSGTQTQCGQEGEKCESDINCCNGMTCESQRCQTGSCGMEGEKCETSVNCCSGFGLTCKSQVCKSSTGTQTPSAGTPAGGIAPSQCATGSCGTQQTGCADNWSALSSQCNAYFSGSCSGIAAYLSAMAADCASRGKGSLVGGNCSNITSGNHYGACAYAYANYAKNLTPGTQTPSGTQAPSGTQTPSGTQAPSGFSGKGIEIPTGTGLPDPRGGIAQIIRNLLTWLLGIVGVIAIIGFVISGVQYLTSAGSEERMESAKRNMLYAIIGVVVVLSSFVIIQAIQYALEARSMF